MNRLTSSRQYSALYCHQDFGKRRCLAQVFLSLYASPPFIFISWLTIKQAKGYPDLITRSFLQLVNEINPQLPIFVLVDFDPDGLNIFRCYRYGSGTVGQRAVSNNEGIRWLGIKTSHILELAATVYNPPTGVDELINSSQSSTQSSSSRVSMSSTACREPISHLSARDRKVAVGTLTKLSDADSDDDEAVELRREFQVMLMMGVKAEIQWLDESGSITDWLDDKIGGAMSALT